MQTRVCIIGAGVGGLSVIRYLKETQSGFKITCYEQTGCIGGTWMYTDRVGKDERGLPLHSSMYKFLRTNVPKEIMQFEGLEYPANLPSFIGHEDFLNYIKRFCSEYSLEDYIQFNTKVDHVEPILTSDSHGKEKWKVTVTDLECNLSKTEEFDAVVVCNGRFSIPFFPDIQDLDTFTGHYIHSHDYRVSEAFEGQSVVCVGAMSSGQDISAQLIDVAKKVYLSTSKPPLQFIKMEKITQIPAILKIDSNNITFTDNSSVSDVDTIIFCTGYKYSYPFLNKNCHPNIKNNKKITPLFQHIIHVEYPSLYFIGLPDNVNPTSLLISQAKFIAAALNGSVKLPSRAEMYQQVDQFYTNATKQLTELFSRPLSMVSTQWEYYDHLAELGGYNPLPVVTKKIFDAVVEARFTDLSTFRDINYQIINDEQFTECVSKK